MKGTNNGAGKTRINEVVAYAFGHTEEWIRHRSQEVGVPYETIAVGVSELLAATGNRAGVLVPQMRGEAAGTSEILQPEMALALRSRDAVQGTEQKGPTSRRLTPQRRKRILGLLDSGMNIHAVAKKVRSSWITVKNIQKEAKAA